jgi:hypothetical protein
MWIKSIDAGYSHRNAKLTLSRLLRRKTPKLTMYACVCVMTYKWYYPRICLHILEINDIVVRKYMKAFKNKLIHIYVHTSMTYVRKSQTMYHVVVELTTKIPKKYTIIRIQIVWPYGGLTDARHTTKLAEFFKLALKKQDKPWELLALCNKYGSIQELWPYISTFPTSNKRLGCFMDQSSASASISH